MPLPPHRDPGAPDSRGPVRYLGWLLRRQPARVARGALWGTLSMVGVATAPFLVGHAIDDGLRDHDIPALLWWVVGIVLLGGFNAFTGMARHRTMTFVRMDANMRTIQVVTRRAARLGAVLPKRVGSGEVVSIGTADVNQIAEVMTMAGPGVGSLIACIVVAALILAISPILAAVVLIGVPAVVVTVGPLLGRLRHTETEYRRQQGEVTAAAGDIVAGLRVLRGIGGETRFADRYRERSQQLRREGYRVGAVSSWIHALGAGLPGLLLAVITWLAAHMVAAGTISFGDMAAVYGYAAVLSTPVYFFIEAAFAFTEGRVAASRVVAVLNLAPDVDDTTDPAPGPRAPADLHDPESGITVGAGRLTGIATGQPGDAIALCDRITRYTDTTATFGDIALSDMSLDEIRERILLSGNDSYLFAGTLRDMVTLPGEPDAPRLTAAIHTAAADDIVASLPDGLDTVVDGQARTLSGGQRQRVRLARALFADPEVLVLVEPTSAVDAHTEAAIAHRLTEHRAGRTTVVVGTSPLLLDACDQVIHLDNGRCAASGTHSELLRRTGYRALVTRGVKDDLAGSAMP